MELQQRRFAQVVRDFMAAYEQASEIAERLERGEMDFGWIDRLVGEPEESTLHHLKEECHALFRGPDGPAGELHAAELFDLAVGALFHEAMRLREGYYLATHYGPRFEQAAAGPMAEPFRRVFESGRRRLDESVTQTAELFRETRDQLRILLREQQTSGVVARSLLEDPERTERVFGTPLSALLQDIYGSPTRGFALALESLIDYGHYAEAGAMLRCDAAREHELCRNAELFADGMARYYAGDPAGALESLTAWNGDGIAAAPSSWTARARGALAGVADSVDLPDPELATRARALLRRLPV